MDPKIDTSASTEVLIRPYRASDHSVLQDILVEAFDGVCIDQAIEFQVGLIAENDWKWRKGRDLNVDLERDINGVLVADIGGCPVGFISTWQDTNTGIGHIPNLAVAWEHHGLGIGRKLIKAAIEHFRHSGLAVAKIETLQQNKRANGLYLSEGFVEVARQRHLVQNLRSSRDNVGEAS